LGRKIDTIIEATVARTGGMYYIRLPKETVDFYDIRLGDKLKVRILELKEKEKGELG